MADSSQSITVEDLVAQQQQKAEMIADEDPLLISQSLTYVTDDGGTLHTFQSANFSTGSLANKIIVRVCSFRLESKQCDRCSVLLTCLCVLFGKLSLLIPLHRLQNSIYRCGSDIYRINGRRSTYRSARDCG